MRIQCPRDPLLRAVHTVGRAVSPRSSMPILSHILLDAAQDRLRLGATDLNLGIETTIATTVEEPGTITVPARILAEIMASLPDGASVEFEVAEGKTAVAISCASARFEILGLPGADFPAMPGAGGTTLAAIEAPLLRTMIQQTAFAVSSDETRPFLTGVCLSVGPDTIRLAATDGGRLAVRTARPHNSTSETATFIIPVRTLTELGRALAGEEGAVTLASTDHHVVFATPTTRFTCRPIAGQFPAYEQVIPKDYTQEILVDATRFREAVRRATITAKDSSTVVRLAALDSTLTITSNTPDVGHSKEDVPARSSGAPIATAFNGTFLLDVLSTIDGEVLLGLTGPLAPAALRPVGGTDYTCVIAPVRVHG